jgi:hypothetical protein
LRYNCLPGSIIFAWVTVCCFAKKTWGHKDYCVLFILYNLLLDYRNVVIRRLCKLLGFYFSVFLACCNLNFIVERPSYIGYKTPNQKKVNADKNRHRGLI